MKEFNAPIYNEIINYLKTEPVSFHMPGHKLGNGLLENFKKNLAACDLTEIPGLDNLHYPEDIIKKAQALLAEAYGADESFFLVNGSTCGILAAISSICKEGDSLIVSRDCHKSVINAMVLTGVRPVYIKPGYDGYFGIPTYINPSDVENILARNPDVKGVFITSPNYYGICSDIRKISDIVHKAGKLLIVDEAHGAHLVFNGKLPGDALGSGADICIQSAHKTLPALTQGAYLHVRGNKTNISKLKYFLRIFQTSSPSYVIMASLDMARATMAAYGKEKLDKLLEGIFLLKNSLTEIEGITFLSDNNVNYRHDETRIVINLKGLGISGFYVEKILRRDYKIQVEMSDLYNIVLITTVSDKIESFDRLKAAIWEISYKFKNNKPLTDIYNTELPIPAQLVPLKETIDRESKTVRLPDSVKRISAEAITPYPPGIPLVYPGEEITPEILDYISKLMDSGGKVNGIGNNGEISVLI